MHDEFYDQGIEKAKQKDYAGAIAKFNQSLQVNPGCDTTYLQRGLAYYDSGAFLQAVADYTEALKLNPQGVEAYYCRALARVALKNLPGALKDVEQAIYFHPDYAPAYSLRGVVQRKQGNIPEAIANWKKAAALYLEQKDQKNCRLILDKIKQLQPPKTAAPIIRTTGDYFIHTLDQAEKGDTRQAIADLNWVLQVDPQDAQAYCCRGVVRYKMGAYRQAIADFNQALKLNFQECIVYRNRGKARFQLGDHQGALADLNQSLKIQPEDPLGYIARAQVYREMGNYLQALQDYNQALQINPQDPQIYHNRAITYTLIEEMPKAIADYQQAASIYCEEGNWQNYQEVLDSLQKINSSTPKPKTKLNDTLRQRLLRLVGGHWEIAQRLIQQQQDHHPGMSQEWYLQKVIDDWEQG